MFHYKQGKCFVKNMENVSLKTWRIIHGNFQYILLGLSTKKSNQSDLSCIRHTATITN